MRAECKPLAAAVVLCAVFLSAEGALEVREVSDGVFSVLRDGGEVAVNVRATFQSCDPKSVERSCVIAPDGSKVWNFWSKDAESRFRFEVVQRMDGAVELSILGSAYENAGNRQRGIQFDLPMQFRGKRWRARVDTLRDNPRQEGVFGEGSREFCPRELSSDGIVFDFNPYGPGEFSATGNNHILPVWKAKAGCGEGAARLEGLADFDHPLGGYGGTKVVIREGAASDYCHHHVWEYFNYEQQFPTTRCVKFGAPKAGVAYVEGNFAFDPKKGCGWVGTAVPVVKVGHRSGVYYSHAVGAGRAVYRFAGLEPGYYLATIQLGNYTDETNKFSVTAAGEKLGGELTVAKKKARTVSRFVHVDGGTCDFAFEGQWLVSAIALQMRIHDSEDFTIRRGFWYVEGYEPAIAYRSEYYRQTPEFPVSDETIDMPVPGKESDGVFRKPPLPISLPRPKDVEWTSKMRLWKLMTNNSTMMELADDDYRERLFTETLARRPYNTVMFNGMLSRHTFPKERIELGKRLTSKFVKTAKRHGLKTVEHVDLTLLWNREVGVRTMIERTGQLIREYENNLPSLQLCINNPEMRRWIYGYLRGQVEAGYDAMMLDECCFYHHGCVCRHCRERFHRETGWLLPLDETDPTFLSYRETELSRRWDEWKKATADTWRVEVREYLKQFNPNLVFMTYSTLKNFTMPEVKASARVYSHGRSRRPFPARSISVFGNEVMTENVLLGSRSLLPMTRARGLLRTDPAIPPLWNWYYNHDQNCNYFSWCLATMCGQTAFLTDLPPEAGIPDPESWAGVSRSMDICEAEPEARVALLFSVDSRDFNPDDKFEAELLGLAQELEALHVPYAFLGDDYLDAEHLNRYKVVFLGDAQCIRDGGYEALKNFIRAGGRVYGQKGAGLRNEYGEEVAGRTPFAEMSSAAPFRADEVIPWKSPVWEFGPDLKAEEAFRGELAALVGDAAFWQLRGVPEKVYTSVWREHSGELLLHFLNATAANLKKGDVMGFSAPKVPFPPMAEDFVITVPAAKGAKAVAYSPDWGVEGRELPSEARPGEKLEIRLPKELFKAYALVRVASDSNDVLEKAATSWTAPMLAFRDGIDRYEGSDPRIRQGALDIYAGDGHPRFKPYVFSKPVPVRGPSMVQIKVDEEVVDGSACLEIKEFESKKISRFSSPWRREMVFKTDLDPAKRYVFSGLSFCSTGAAPVHRMRVNSVMAVIHGSEASAVACDVETDTKFHILDWPIDHSPVATFSNRADRVLTVSGKVKVRDFFDRAFEVPVTLTLNPGEERRIELDRRRIVAKGTWMVETELAGADGRVEKTESQFAVLDPRRATPMIPYGKFRWGIHLHICRDPDSEKPLTLDSAMRMGAKIVRIEHVFCGFGTYDFEHKQRDWRPADWMLKALEERGMALNALICSRHGEVQPDGFYTELGARYGDRIDYYEYGNEFDLLTREQMTPRQGIELQKNFYTAIKKGSPKARVSTNGWAVEDSNGHGNVTQKGFQEEFMRDAKGYYDIHAMHLHFPFADYVDRLGRFFKMRKAVGVDDVPWFLNETALTSKYRAQKEVAENVWQKILYAWAKGAKDYVWYSLRGGTPGAGPGYDVTTHDYRPYLQYCAFSGFTAVFEGHDLERELIDATNRKAYLHRGANEFVISGWDTASTKPMHVGIVTDAKRALLADIMNNRRELPVVDGKVVWPIVAEPTAVILVGATRAVPIESELKNVAMPTPCSVRIEKVRPIYCGWDFAADKMKQVKEFYAADPATKHRAWKGKQDCSAYLLFTRTPEGKVRLRMTVRDDKDTSGDRIEIWRDGRNVTQELKFERFRRGENTVYYADWPEMRDCRFNYRVRDDDGFGGEDGWLEYVPFEDSKIDVALWPLVKFD